MYFSPIVTCIKQKLNALKIGFVCDQIQKIGKK